MHLHIVCALLCIWLQFASADTTWEVINDVKPFDDSGTQEDILLQEELILYKVNKPRPKPKAAPKTSVNKNAGLGDLKKTLNIPILPAAPKPRPAARLSDEKSEVEEEELLPLGVPGPRRIQRHLLQALPVQGPRLPPDEELKRLIFRSGSVNLSTGCKDSSDDDCLFDVDEFVAKQLLADPGVQREDLDFEFVDQEVVNPGREREEYDEIPLSRHKRQSNNNNDDDDEDDDDADDDDDDSESDDSDSDESSGIDLDNAFDNRKGYKKEGTYKAHTNLTIDIPDGTDQLTDEDLETYRKEIEKELEEVLKDAIPGFDKVIVDTPKIINGKLVVNYTVCIDGEELSNKYNDENVEENFLKDLGRAGNIFENTTILNGTVDPSSSGFLVDELATVTYDYCDSADPCPDAGPEYDVTACVNTGFMSGYCPHKCEHYDCQNKATCELDENHEPFCNCGRRFTGQYCETKKTKNRKKKKLKKAEKVAVGVASVAVALALMSCCFFLCCCWRRKREVNYTYYEDTGDQEFLSDPTSVDNYCIDRPHLFTSPVGVFNSQAFDA